MAEQTQLRDAFSLDTISQIGSSIADCWPEFDRSGFERSAGAGFEALSFGPRAQRICDALIEYLPDSFDRAVEILVCSLGPEPETDHLDGLAGFYIVPLTMYISSVGIERPEVALPALYEMTKRFSAESEIRPFISRHPDQTLAFLHGLTTDKSPFARRLASEGTRPRLPLTRRLPEFQNDPSPVIKLLDRLYADDNLMVRRSVANNLNDIAKDNPDAAVAALERWHAAQRRENDGAISDELDWLTRHALRTLVKTSHPGALTLLGYGSGECEITAFSASPESVALGETVEIVARLRSSEPEPQKIALNYAIDFLRASGRRSTKIFRLPDRTLVPGEELEISKRHELLPYRNQTFRSGDHPVRLLVNGVPVADSRFLLTVPEE
jgi:3-methyladenine DNA glycosylase AlkC